MSSSSSEGYYLGIDLGTQGLSVILTDTDLHVVATGDASYDFCPNQLGCYEQNAKDWESALQQAMKVVLDKMNSTTVDIVAIGIAGQMHGEVLVNEQDQVLTPVRLWCDARNEQEGHLLTEHFQTKVPKRATVARFLWTIRNRPDIARQVRHLTTPAGWIAFCLTGEWNLGTK